MNIKMNINNTFISPNRYKEYYEKVICQDLILKQSYSCFMELPKLEKLLIHTTSKYYVQDEKNIFSPFLGLEMVSGQKPKLNYARKSISTFKLREKQLISCKVDLRNQNLYYFLEKLITIILPITRTFSGIKKLKKQSFQKKGRIAYLDPMRSKTSRREEGGRGYHFGLQNLLTFPELETRYQLFEKDIGVDISFVIKNSSIEKRFLLLTAFQFPCER